MSATTSTWLRAGEKKKRKMFFKLEKLAAGG